MRARGIAAIVACVAMAGRAQAHGVGHRRSSLPPVALELAYSTGEPMSYAEARVFSPSDGDHPHQSGRTDAAGRVAFVPDAAGTWRVVVSDGQGHQATATIDVGEGDVGRSIDVHNHDRAGGGLVVRAALGASLLLNVAAVVTLVRRRRGA